MSKSKLIFGAVVVVAAIFVINQAKKDPSGLLGKLGSIGA